MVCLDGGIWAHGFGFEDPNPNPLFDDLKPLGFGFEPNPTRISKGP
jgi:hypothetical protein